MFAAPTNDQARRIYWEDLKAMVPPNLIRRISESRLEVQILTGTTFQVAGMDKPQRIEGMPIDGIVLDEYADMKPETWTHSVRPALDSPGRPGWAVFIGKAKLGAAHYRKLCNDVIAGRPGWEYYHWKSSTVLTEDEIEEAKRDLDPLTFACEYDAEWGNAEGRAYYCFQRELQANQRLHYDPWRPLILCFDFNVSPGSAVICQELEYEGQRHLVGPDGNQYTVAPFVTAVIGEINIPRNSNTVAVCRRIAEDWKGHKTDVLCYGDATGGAKGTAKIKGSDWELIEAELRPVFGDKLDFYVKRANPPERARINAVNSRLLTTDGTIHCLVDPEKAPTVVDDFDNVLLLEGGAGEIDKKKDKTITHWTDAFGYYIESEHPIDTTGEMTRVPIQ